MKATSIEFNNIPPTSQGGPLPVSPISGRVKGAQSGDKIVVFAKDAGGIWWVQPQAAQPFTSIKADSTWEAPTHLGTEYAALLVSSEYLPPSTTNALPGRAGPVRALAVTKGTGSLVIPPAKMLQFSGYEWKAVNLVSERNGVPNQYEPENVSTDATGALHLRIAKKADRWSCSQVILPHSFGYGTYLFSVRDASRLPPAAVLTLFVWDALGADQNHREMDIEISRWGDPAGRNAQFVVQPYYVPDNVVRFTAFAGPMNYLFRWEPSRVTFRAYPQTSENAPAATHVFTSAVPSPGTESASMNFCLFGPSKVPLQHDTEVVIDRFQYLP